MSISDRLGDAQLLYSSMRRDGALLSVLVAAAASSRKRYDRSTHKDRQAFSQWIDDETAVITGGGVRHVFVRVPGANARRWPNEQMPLGECLYEFVRCTLAHEGTMPTNVEFIEGDQGSYIIESSSDALRLSTSWIGGIAKAVQHAPENADEFPELATIPDDVRAWILFGTRRGRLNDYMVERSSRVLP